MPPGCLKLLLLLLVLLTTVTVPACDAADVTAQAGSAGVGTWTYDRTSRQGPLFWSTVPSNADGTMAFPLCRTAVQSPIALTNVQVSPALSALDLSGYASSAFTVVNDGRVLRAVPTGAVSILVFNNARWKLTLVEFHSPGEHSFGGARRDMEIHLVHQLADASSTASLIVAVSVVASTFGSHGIISTLFEDSYLPPYPRVADVVLPGTPPSVVQVGNTSAQWVALFPTSKSYFTYNGTWTYPPCSPAQWIVMEEPITVSSDQVGRLRAAVLGSRYAPTANSRLTLGTAPSVVSKYVEGSVVASVVCDTDPGRDAGSAQLGVGIAALIITTVSIVLCSVILAMGPAPDSPAPKEHAPVS